MVQASDGLSAVSGDLRLLFLLPGNLPYKDLNKCLQWELLHVEPQYSSQEYAVFFQEGEERGFAWFFRLLYPSLTLYAGKILGDRVAAEEIAATAFMKIWQRHGQFDSPASIKAYLYKIVRNDALKALKKDQRQAVVYDTTGMQVADSQKNQFQTLVDAEVSRHLRASVDLLPPQCSKVFRLLYLEGKTIKETATQLRLSESTIKTQKARGLAILRKTMIWVVVPYILLLILE